MEEASRVENSGYVEFKSSEEGISASPGWHGEMVLMAQVWKESGLLEEFNKKVKVQRGRAGKYAECDFLLQQLGYVCGHEESWRSFFESVDGQEEELAMMWGRRESPSRSALSRYQESIGKEALEEFAKLLFKDLLRRGVGPELLGGVRDRNGQKHVVFDVDGTRQTWRQRSLVCENSYPPARRRSGRLAARGYTGRKRGEVVRTRTCLLQAHTGEWLGTFGSPGNGKALEELEWAANNVVSYLQARGLPERAGVVRLDGLYGWANFIVKLAQKGLGYIARCSDYGLLQLLGVPSSLQDKQMWHLPGSGSSKPRELYDLGWLEWEGTAQASGAVPTRLILLRHHVGRAKPKVGKKLGEFVYELFVTDRDNSALTPPELIKLYKSRGGFEGVLAWENQEQQLNRFYSANPYAQQWCQLLAQWVWNQRLWLGLGAKEPAQRTTLWSDASQGGQAPPQDPQAPSEAPLSPESRPYQGQEFARFEPPAPDLESRALEPSSDSLQTSPLSAREQSSAHLEPARPTSPLEIFSPRHFRRIDSHTLLCPAGKFLKATERRLLPNGQRRQRFSARARDCAQCSLALRCRPKANSHLKGRRVTLPLTPALPPPEKPLPGSRARPFPTPRLSPGPSLVCWVDLPARHFRTTLARLLPAMDCQFTPAQFAQPLSHNPTLAFFTPDQRAHRRLTFTARLATNALPPPSRPAIVHLRGLPLSLSNYLSNLEKPPSAA